MASPQSHKSSQSLSNATTSLALPSATAVFIKQQRRMTSPAPAPGPLNLPEPAFGNGHSAHRPPSPLRHGFTADAESEDGSDIGEDNDHDNSWDQPHSSAASVTKLATSFAQRVGSFVNNINNANRSGDYLPTDAELEAEAERERDRTRREAEQILTREAEERKLMEDKVFALLQSTQSSPIPVPNRSQTTPIEAHSPASSQKEGAIPRWWAAAKNRLTPTKEPLTPAQQIVQETKEKEKRDKKAMKDKSRDKEEWPSCIEGKYVDPSPLNLNIPPEGPLRPPAHSSPSSPTPHRSQSLPPSLAPSPLRSNDGHTSSPSREAPPLYAQFNSQGTLDVHGTLLVIAKRFEKLEKWTVGHVRALEERMSDVERWLVEKENEKEERERCGDQDTAEGLDQTVNEIREEIIELQGRIGELGREMAKIATSPANLSLGPSRMPGPVSSAPQTASVIAVHSHTLPPVHPVASNSRISPKRRESMSISPPFVPTQASSTHTPRSRLPYPTGDYATPPDTILLSQGVFSPTNSPPSSVNSATRNQSMAIAGLPSSGTDSSASNSRLLPSGLPISSSPPTGPSSSPGLTAPKTAPARPSSISPTPRKRYTVALGGPIMNAAERSARMESTVRLSEEDVSSADDKESSSQRDESYDETIGKSTGRVVSSSTTYSRGSEHHSTDSLPLSSSHHSPPGSRSRSQMSVAPLKTRMRSRSTDRYGLGITEDGFTPLTPSTGKFVDPLVVRKQEKQSLASAASRAPKAHVGKRKVPVGELVAFFDGGDKS